jgi:hypothetical protein
MPLTAKGEKIKEALTKEYGAKKGEQVLYAGKNKGTFTGIDALERAEKAGEKEREAQRQAKELLDGKHVSGRDRGRLK